MAKKDLGALRSDEALLRERAQEYGIFVNSDTLETEIAGNADLREALLGVLAEQAFGWQLSARIQRWRDDEEEVDPEQLMLMIGYVSKGRFAGQLAAAIEDLEPPEYIGNAIRRIAEG